MGKQVNPNVRRQNQSTPPPPTYNLCPSAGPEHSHAPALGGKSSKAAYISLMWGKYGPYTKTLHAVILCHTGMGGHNVSWMAHI